MTRYRFGNCEVDDARGSLRVGGAEVPLRPKAMDLLMHLLNHRGQLVTKDALMSALWPNVIVTEDSLTQAVAAVRQALGAEGARFLRTLLRRGYLFDEASVRVDEDVPTAKPLILPGSSDRIWIVVQPFASTNLQFERAWLAAGMATEIATALSRIAEFCVVSALGPAETETVDGPNVQQLPEEVTAYHLRGSLRSDALRVRISVALVEVETGQQIWAERYDRPFEDSFALQDDIARNVAIAALEKLSLGDVSRLWDGRTHSLAAWEQMVLGRELFLQFNPADTQRAITHLRAALLHDPGFSGAMVQLGLCHWWNARSNPMAANDAELAIAEALAEQAMTISPDLGAAQMLVGGIRWLQDRHDEALALVRKAVAISPGDPWTLAFLALVANFAGEDEVAVAFSWQAIALSPRGPSWYTYTLAHALCWTGDFATASSHAGAYLQREPGDPFAYFLAAVISAFASRPTEAAEMVSKLRLRFPEFGLENLRRSQRYKDPDRLARVLAAMQDAGLPDNMSPPGAVPVEATQ